MLFGLAAFGLSLLLVASARAVDIRVDFYPGAADPSTGTWNVVQDVGSPGGDIANLLNNDGSQSDISLTITDAFYGGNNYGNTWVAPPDFRSWVDAAATNDQFFVFHDNGDRIAQITFAGSGLDDTKTYRIEANASRNHPSFTKLDGEYRVNGQLSDNWNSADYHAKNDGYLGHQVMTWRSVKPVGGQIVLDLEASTLPQNPAYLGAMRITDDTPRQTILVDLGDAGRQTDGRWNNIVDPDYETLAGTGSPGHRVLGAINAAGQRTAVDLNILDDFDTRNTGGLVSDAAGFAADAQSDALCSLTGETTTVQIEGLVPGRQYDVTLFGSSNLNRTTEYTIGGTTQTLVNYNNTSNSVTFADVSPDAHGHIQVDLVGVGAAGYLGAVEITGDFEPMATNPPRPSIFYDFGVSNRKTGGNWNDMIGFDAGSRLDDAVDSLGRPTAVDLVVASGFNPNGANNIGEFSDDAGYPITAQSDSFWFDPSHSPQIRIEGLNPNGEYDFTLFGSRQPVAGSLRSVDITIGGQTITLVNSGNTGDVASFFDVQPDAGGNVLIDLTVSSGADFGYVGVLEIVMAVPEPSSVWLAGLALIGLVAIVRPSRRRRV